jgi:hypothetical protein
VNCAVVALQQHFRNARGTSEVPVNLENLLTSIEQVRRRSGTQEIRQPFVGFVTILQTRPETDVPGTRPSSPRAGPVGDAALD